MYGLCPVPSSSGSEGPWRTVRRPQKHHFSLWLYCFHTGCPQQSFHFLPLSLLSQKSPRSPVDCAPCPVRSLGLGSSRESCTPLPTAISNCVGAPPGQVPPSVSGMSSGTRESWQLSVVLIHCSHNYFQMLFSQSHILFSTYGGCQQALPGAGSPGAMCRHHSQSCPWQGINRV